MEFAAPWSENVGTRQENNRHIWYVLRQADRSNSQACRKSRDLVLNYPVLFRVPIVKVICFLRIPANIVSFKISCRNYCLCSDVKKLILYPNINILAECIIAPWMTVRVALPLIIKPLFQNFLQKLLLVFWRKKINIVS